MVRPRMKKQIDYVSEATSFVRDLLRERPHLLEEQRKARARWWDRQPDAPVDPVEAQKVAESRVKQQGYVYQTKL